MSPRAFAAQGVGFGPRALATQGLLSVQATNREVAVQGVGYGPGPMALQGFFRRSQLSEGPGKKILDIRRRRRRDRDDDVLMFLLR